MSKLVRLMRFVRMQKKIGVADEEVDDLFDAEIEDEKASLKS